MQTMLLMLIFMLEGSSGTINMRRLYCWIDGGWDVRNENTSTRILVHTYGLPY